MKRSRPGYRYRVCPRLIILTMTLELANQEIAQGRGPCRRRSGQAVYIVSVDFPKSIIHWFSVYAWVIHVLLVTENRHVGLASYRPTSSNKKLHNASRSSKSWCMTLTSQRVSLIPSNSCRSFELGGDCCAQSVQIENISSCERPLRQPMDQNWTEVEGTYLPR